jgi:hypothetical protein
MRLMARLIYLTHSDYDEAVLAHPALRICHQHDAVVLAVLEEDCLLIACSEAMTVCCSFAVLSKRNPGSVLLVRTHKPTAKC